MLKNIFGRGAPGLAAVVALCAALSAQAQTGGTGAAAGSTGAAQTGSQGGQAGQAGQTGGAAAATATGQSTDPQDKASGMQSGSGSKAGTQAGTLNASDQRMLKTMAVNNLAEIEAGRMAQSKSQNDEVKNFAQRMIDDHTRALDDVRQLAQAKGVALPTEVDAAHKRQAARLAALSGDAFDRAYMAQAGVADHKQSHALLRRAEARARDPDLKALVARTLPVVDQHLTTAQQLHKNTAQGSSKTKGATGSSGDQKR